MRACCLIGIVFVAAGCRSESLDGAPAPVAAGTSDVLVMAAGPSSPKNDAGVASITALSFHGYAHEGPNLVTHQFDPHEPQLFIDDADECAGHAAMRGIAMDLYAYGLPNGAVPGSYPLTNEVGGTNGPTNFSTFSIGGFEHELFLVSGTLTLSRVDAAEAVGSFDAILADTSTGTNVEMKASFTAPFCP